ncbi:hypothetical protein Vadar_028975 [Vaccinium darrowii]|uniref:Uncharacterized protein n=1 Tax=Vaccinium darrowii TaxID=229202 RepID=A0ACB7Y9W1_9ERIC|nr:hypothetical protein Vadar_028975 [Vaccinium darrowii]
MPDDFFSSHSPTTPLEKRITKPQAAGVYTRKIFKLFQEELFLSQKQCPSKFHEEGTRKIYKVVENEKIVSMKWCLILWKIKHFVHAISSNLLVFFVKKSHVNHLPEHYILRRWTINAKNHIANEISSTLMSEVLLQGGTKNSSTLPKHKLMIEVLKVVEEGQKSQKKHDHLTLALQKVHRELLDMDEEDEDVDEIDIDGDLGSESLYKGGAQLLSNITFTLHDPPWLLQRVDLNP